MNNTERKKIKRSPLSKARIIMFSFAVAILIGALLLMLPISTKDGEGASFLDALFTSTSAICVTGLIVRDTATYWSLFGKFVVITLIQIGGMGVITLMFIFIVISKKKISLANRALIQDAISAPHLGGVGSFTKFVVITTVIIELIGAALMYPVFAGRVGYFNAIGYSLFHSISAFCNAGFDLMGYEKPFSSLTSFSSNAVISIVIPLLILTGGISFLLWKDIHDHKYHIKRYRLQSKIILCVTFVIVLLPFLYFLLYEFNRDCFGYMTLKEKILSAFFQTVTPRTAGFNTVDLTKISETGQAIMIVLMLIGGAPGSTAGGMKMTTVAVIILCVRSVFKREETPQCFGRRIDLSTVQTAASIFAMFIILSLAASGAIACIENVTFITAMYEVASAIATVGLTLGITTKLHTASKIILILLMFFGRVGSVTCLFAAMSGNQRSPLKLPSESVNVG